MKIKTLFFAMLMSGLLYGCYYDYLMDMLDRDEMEQDTLITTVPPAIDCFTDLTPNDGFNSEYSFNGLKFKKYLKELHPASPAQTFTIPKPEFLTNKSTFIVSKSWVKTCEFAFEDQDFSGVLDAITSAAAAYPDIKNVQTTESLAWNEAVSGYSKAGEYWLVPIFLDNGKIWLKIDRRVDKPGRYGSYFYTATAYWMNGYEKDIDGDVS